MWRKYPNIDILCYNIYMKNNFAYIYALIEGGELNIHNIRYIGKTVQTLKSRLSGHISKSRHHKTHCCCWINNLISRDTIPTIFPIIIVEINEAEEMEKRIINLYRKLGARLTNLVDGGPGNLGWKPSSETRVKMSLARIGKAPWHKGTHGVVKRRIGWHHSDETKRKISLSKTGIIRGPLSNETKQKISRALKGRTVSNETKGKMSEAKRGLIPWNKDKINVYSKEYKEKISASLKKYHAGKKS